MATSDYLKKVVMMLVGAATGFSCIAGGYYTIYQVVTLIGNN